jgi:hypothetical protein
MQARTKLVTFRLSEQEYQHLCAVSAKCGARRVSEFVCSGVGGIVEKLRAPALGSPHWLGTTHDDYPSGSTRFAKNKSMSVRSNDQRWPDTIS